MADYGAQCLQHLVYKVEVEVVLAVSLEYHLHRPPAVKKRRAAHIKQYKSDKHITSVSGKYLEID